MKSTPPTPETPTDKNADMRRDRRIVRLADDLTQREPVGYLVYEDETKTDCFLLDKEDAMRTAEILAEDNDADSWPIYPLWAGNPETNAEASRAKPNSAE